MPTRHIKQRIHHLRQQPEAVRYRAVTVLTAISGLVIGIIWLTVLLPLQLALTRPSSNDTDTTVAVEDNLTAPAAPSSAVSGVHDVAPLPTLTPLPPPTGGSPTSQAPPSGSLPAAENTAPDETTSPVEITE